MRRRRFASRRSIERGVGTSGDFARSRCGFSRAAASSSGSAEDPAGSTHWRSACKSAAAGSGRRQVAVLQTGATTDCIWIDDMRDTGPGGTGHTGLQVV